MSMHERVEKIVLIIPPSPWLITDREIPFYGLLNISSYLKQKGVCEVSVCDLSSLPEDKWFIPIGDLYGVTGSTPQFIYIRDIVQKLKERETHKPVIVGGVHATVLPEHILENTLADACVRGEGETAILKIVEGEEWKSIKGIVTREFDNGFSAIIQDLDSLPRVDRKEIDYYSYLPSTLFNYLDTSVKREGSIITGRGCPGDCTFCCSKMIHQRRVRLESVERVVDEFIYLKREFDIEMVNILDDTFTLNKKRAAKICDLLIEKKVDMKWFCLTRPDDVDLDILKLMKKAGCLSVAPGFESGSNRILKLMNKRTTSEQIRQYVKMAYAAGLKINGQLIVGFPTETEEDIDLTVKLIKDNPEVDTFGLHTFYPYPGCDVWNNPEKYNYTIDKNTDFSDYHSVGNHKTGIYSKDPLVNVRFLYIKSVIGNKSRELRRGLIKT